MKSRAAALGALLVLVLTACGARLTPEQRLAGIGSLRGGSSGGTDTGNGPGTGPGTGPTVGPGGTGGPSATTGPGGGPGGGPGAAACTSAGATDTGVTGNQITLAVASDVSGVQAALFKSTHQAMTAFAAYVNSQGGICGRFVKPLLLDSRADSTANLAAVTEACGKAFALVGSMSAFDNGGAGKGAECGIPDITAITVNGARADAKNVYPAYPIGPHRFGLGTGVYIKEKYPEVIKDAAMFYLNAGVTKSNALQRVNAYKTIGFDFRMVQEVQLSEPNWGIFVQQMKEEKIQYVSFVGNYQNIQKMLDAMAQVEYFPKVRDWDSVAYSPLFLETLAPVDGSKVFLNTNLFEEASGNPEMQLYLQWLARVAPGAKPDYFGIYAWSAGRLFQKVALAVGGKLTRKAILGELAKVHSWDGAGLHAAHDVGSKIMSPCFIYLEIRSKRFVREAPSSGFICNKGGVIRT